LTRSKLQAFNLLIDCTQEQAGVYPMKSTALVFCLAAAVAAHAQTAAKPATHTATTARTASAASGPKLPPNIPMVHGIVKTAFSLKYEDIKVGTGPEAEPIKMYKVKYTGWRAADGVKFDSWDEHPAPVLDADGKPVMGDDGKPKTGDPQPASFPVGIGRMIPGFDQGFIGMKVGGKRRLFIPWQLAYGTRAMPDHGADHPGIPAKSDLIFDVELVEMTDLQMAPPPGHAGQTGTPGIPVHPPTPAQSAPAGSPSTPPPTPPPPSSK
jgi:peptidylprolyl isomerase